jgi:hypothetical protein
MKFIYWQHHNKQYTSTQRSTYDFYCVHTDNVILKKHRHQIKKQQTYKPQALVQIYIYIRETKGESRNERIKNN